VGSFVDARSCGRPLAPEDGGSRRGAGDTRVRGRDAPYARGFGLHWDGAVEYQSARTEHYDARRSRSLTALGLTSSAVARAASAPSRAVIRDVPRRPRRRGPTATRFRSRTASCPSRIGRRGSAGFPLGRARRMSSSDAGRRVAYQLAVWWTMRCRRDRCGARRGPSGQHALAAGPAGCVAAADSRYAHLPLITEPGGAKLAKSRRSVALDRPNGAASCRKPSPCWARNLQLRLSSSHPKRCSIGLALIGILDRSRACGRCALRPQVIPESRRVAVRFTLNSARSSYSPSLGLLHLP